jgi:hypothetical protein
MVHVSLTIVTNDCHNMFIVWATVLKKTIINPENVEQFTVTSFVLSVFLSFCFCHFLPHRLYLLCTSLCKTLSIYQCLYNHFVCHSYCMLLSLYVTCMSLSLFFPFSVCPFLCVSLSLYVTFCVCHFPCKSLSLYVTFLCMSIS